MDCAQPHTNDGGSVLLVVDDYPENLISMRALLARQDWQVITASSGTEALSALLEHEVDLVLLDVQMPGMDGFEVARLMRGSQRTRLTPIIFLTANEQSQAAVLKGYASGAVDYLFKPFDPQILKPKVQALLEQQRNRRSLQRLSHDLEAERAFNASVLENAAEGILVVAEDGLIRFANPAISSLLDASFEHLQGKGCWISCCRPDRVCGVSRRSIRLIWRGTPCVFTMLSCVRPAGIRSRWPCRVRRYPASSGRW